MQVLNIFHVLIAIAMVAFVLVQRGAGATAGAAFGSGASGTVFGSRGAGSFLSRATWVLAGLFCLISLTMAVVVSRNMTAPETDMGVVGTSAAEQPVIETTADLPELDLPETGGDMPSVNTEDAVPSAGDLPLIDGADAIGSEDQNGEENADGNGG